MQMGWGHGVGNYDTGHQIGAGFTGESRFHQPLLAPLPRILDWLGLCLDSPPLDTCKPIVSVTNGTHVMSKDSAAAETRHEWPSDLTGGKCRQRCAAQTSAPPTRELRAPWVAFQDRRNCWT